MNIEPDKMTDSELDLAIGDALNTVNMTRLADLEAEQDRRLRDVTRKRQADAAARHQAEVIAAAERTKLLATLTDRYDSIGEAYRDAITALSSEPTFARCEAVHVLGIQLADLGNRLASITGQRVRFYRRYDALDQIELHGGLAGRSYVLQAQGRNRPHAPTPWQGDIARLKALTPQTTLIGNGG